MLLNIDLNLMTKKKRREIEFFRAFLGFVSDKMLKMDSCYILTRSEALSSLNKYAVPTGKQHVILQTETAP